MQEKEKALLDEIIEKVNDLFEGDLTDQDKLVYVNNVIKGKLLESETLRQQAANNTKEQFANSPDLDSELLNAIMGALDAHTAMSTQALNSDSGAERAEGHPAQPRAPVGDAARTICRFQEQSHSAYPGRGAGFAARSLIGRVYRGWTCSSANSGEDRLGGAA